MIPIDIIKPGINYCSCYNGSFVFVLLKKSNGELSVPTYIAFREIEYDCTTVANTYKEKSSQLISKQAFYDKVKEFKLKNNVKTVYIKIK